MDLLRQISDSLQKGDHLAVAELTRQAIDSDVAAGTILREGLLAGMEVIGDRFGACEIFLPDVLLAARAMNTGLELLKPLLIADDLPSLATVVIGTVKGDLHDIGKNLVGIMLQGAGFRVVDLGSDVAPEAFVATAQAEGATVIGLSALLTTTMSGMQRVVDLVRSRGLEGTVRVVVGGAPLSADFARRIGADGYGADAAQAVKLVKSLTGAAR